jgi:hypothetical protein
LGDHVVIARRREGSIKAIVKAGSDEALEFGCPDGCVLVEERTREGSGLCAIDPELNVAEWEDVEFVARSREA